jgi:antitoxin component of MazEF toxin-antitoxin module
VLKKLSAIGNSLGLVIEKPILELLKINRETELEVTTDGKRLIIEPMDHKRRVKVATKRATEKHAKTLRRLAE